MTLTVIILRIPILRFFVIFYGFASGAGKGRIVCGDVGQGRMEELDLIEKGGNYGWNNFEGTNRYCFRCQKGRIISIFMGVWCG